MIGVNGLPAHTFGDRAACVVGEQSIAHSNTDPQARLRGASSPHGYMGYVIPTLVCGELTPRAYVWGADSIHMRGECGPYEGVWGAGSLRMRVGNWLPTYVRGECAPYELSLIHISEPTRPEPI
eukprot:3022308-Pyramimonas_sp.AAC.1